MVKDIITDDTILSVPCEDATADDTAIAQDLVDTIMSLDSAACLAANQIGETKRIGVYLNTAEKPVVLFNPRITQKLKPFGSVEECLSRQEPTLVNRYDWIRVEYDEPVDGKLVPRKKKLEGWTAQLVQHIIDHCNGELV